MTLPDFIAATLLANESQHMKLDDLLRDAYANGFIDVWDMPVEAIVNMVLVEGWMHIDGAIYKPTEADRFASNAPADYSAFIKAAKRVVTTAMAPVTAHNLVLQLGLTNEPVPYSSMQSVMLRGGMHHIAGLGYWHAPVFSREDGVLISKRGTSPELEVISGLFQSEGWPLVSKDIEQRTEGEITSRFMTLMARHDLGEISALGSGLFIPRDRASDKYVPMSRNVADECLRLLDTREKVSDKGSLRFYRIGLVAERRGLASLQRSHTTLGGRYTGVRAYTMRIDWNRKGVLMLRRMASKSDTF